MNKLKSTIFAALALLASFSSHALEVDAKKYEVTVKVKARNSGDYNFLGATSNEYQVQINLQKNQSYRYGDGGSGSFFLSVAPLKGGDIAHNSGIFSPYEALRMGEELTRKTIVHLPTNVMYKTYLGVTVYESDFTIPVPIPCGGCVIPVNEDDIDLKESISLSDGEQELTYSTEFSDIQISIKLVEEGVKELKDILEEQERYIFPTSTFGPDLNYLEKHIIENL
ncbi:MAG: hypothetical protein CME63_16425 [Halobacteriovoraceae bacterium]|nr:hypothetical protein [Halobacteriovoraceae bacterium]